METVIPICRIGTISKSQTRPFAIGGCGGITRVVDCSSSAWKTTGAWPTSIFVEMETCCAGLDLEKYCPFFASVESPATQTSSITTAALAQMSLESFPLAGRLLSCAFLFTWSREWACARGKRQNSWRPLCLKSIIRSL